MRQGEFLNTKAKGNRNEHRSIAILEAAGYRCTRAAASLGVFDIIGIGSTDVVLYNLMSDLAPQNRFPFFFGVRSGTAIVNLKAVGIMVLAAYRNKDRLWFLGHVLNALQSTAIRAYGLTLLSNLTYSDLDQIHTGNARQEVYHR